MKWCARVTLVAGLVGLPFTTATPSFQSSTDCLSTRPLAHRKLHSNTRTSFFADQITIPALRTLKFAPIPTLRTSIICVLVPRSLALQSCTFAAHTRHTLALQHLLFV